MANTSQKQSHNTDTPSGDFSRLYWFGIFVMLLATLVTAILTVEQTQTRHTLYQQIANVRADVRALKVEEERLIIEQQTFSATPIVAKRSAIELKMFYPDDAHRLVLSPAVPDQSE